MIALVRIALSRPYTFVVLALLLLIIGPLAAMRTPTDIFPEIRVPVIAVAWQYTGLPPDQMAGRISTLFQRSLTTTVNDIEHIEANTYPGVSVVKIPPTGIPLEEVEKLTLIEALKMSNWVQKDAAELLSISPRVMNYKIKVLGIDFPRGRRSMLSAVAG